MFGRGLITVMGGGVFAELWSHVSLFEEIWDCGLVDVLLELLWDTLAEWDGVFVMCSV